MNEYSLRFKIPDEQLEFIQSTSSNSTQSQSDEHSEDDPNTSEPSEGV